jgi:hypothetical protein
MALLIDASSPAIAVQATGTTATVASASFTPPAGSTLLIRYSANTIDPVDPGNPTITDSLGAHLTYTSVDIGKRPDTSAADGQVATWTAQVASSAAMTITVTNGAASPNRHAALAVTVLTGADTSTPVGQHGKNSSATTIASIAQGYTATRTGSWGFLVVADWFDVGAETAGGSGNTLEGSADVAANYTYAFLRRTTADGVASSTTTVTATLPGNSSNIRWAWIEILPAVTTVTDPGAPPQTLPWPLLAELVARRQADYSVPAAVTTPSSAETGASALALAATGAAVKVAKQAGAAALPLRGAGAATKIETASGAARVALRGDGFQATSQQSTGAAVLPLRGTGVATRKAVQTGAGVLPLRGTGAVVKLASRAGAGTLALAGAGVDVKVAPAAAAARLVLLGVGQESTGSARSQSGSAVLPLRGTGAGTKSVSRTGTSALALSGAAVHRKVAPGAGRGTVALTAASVAVRRALPVGSSMLLLSGLGLPRAAGVQAGMATVLLRGSGTALRRSSTAGAAALALSGAALEIKLARAVGRATIVLGGSYTKIATISTPTLGDRLEAILNTLISWTKGLGIFDAVQGHEPKAAPARSITAALWLQAMVPAIGQSGLDSTSLRVSWYLRIYQNFLSKPEDSIDPKIMHACATVMERLSGNFDLDLPGVRAIDLMGITGPPMQAEAGYIPQDNKLFRCMTLSIPIIVDDVFAQAA